MLYNVWGVVESLDFVALFGCLYVYRLKSLKKSLLHFFKMGPGFIIHEMTE